MFLLNPLQIFPGVSDATLEERRHVTQERPRRARDGGDLFEGADGRRGAAIGVSRAVWATVTAVVADAEDAATVVALV